MSMGLYEKYKFPDMYTSPELNEATDLMLEACKKYNVIPGIFLFGTDRVKEFLDKGFMFVCVGNDLHHMLSAAGMHLANLSKITQASGITWTKQRSALT